MEELRELDCCIRGAAERIRDVPWYVGFSEEITYRTRQLQKWDEPYLFL
jgi:hypothetical protein